MSNISLYFSGIKPFVCLICNTTFTRQHSLNYHMLIHNNQSRFSCADCGRKFRHPSHFKVKLPLFTTVNHDLKHHVDYFLFFPYEYSHLLRPFAIKLFIECFLFEKDTTFHLSKPDLQYELLISRVIKRENYVFIVGYYVTFLCF